MLYFDLLVSSWFSFDLFFCSLRHIVFFEPAVGDVGFSGFSNPPNNDNNTVYSYHVYCPEQVKQTNAKNTNYKLQITNYKIQNTKYNIQIFIIIFLLSLPKKTRFGRQNISNLVLNVFPPNNKEFLFQDSECDIRHSTGWHQTHRSSGKTTKQKKIYIYIYNWALLNCECLFVYPCLWMVFVSLIMFVSVIVFV